MDNINVIDLVAHAINKQQGQDIADLRRNQARAAIDELCNILEAAMHNDRETFVPDGVTVVNCMRLIARTPSEFLSV